MRLGQTHRGSCTGLVSHGRVMSDPRSRADLRQSGTVRPTLRHSLRLTLPHPLGKSRIALLCVTKLAPGGWQGSLCVLFPETKGKAVS